VGCVALLALFRLSRQEARSASLRTAAGTPAFRASLPNGRIIQPWGNWIPVAPFAFAMALRPDGHQMAVTSIGYPFALNIVSGPDQAVPTVLRIPDSEKSDPNVEVHTGIAYSPDGNLLYDATGNSGAVDVLSAKDWQRVARIPLDEAGIGQATQEGFAADLLLSKDGNLLYVLDQGNWRVVFLDPQTRRGVASVPTGSDPLLIALSPDEKRLFVANSGLFEYKLVRGVRSDSPLETGLHFPPFGFPSKAAREGTIAEGHDVPGLGDENSEKGSSLWTYDIASPQSPRLIAKLRLGSTIGDAPHGVVGGACPSGIAAGADHVYVSLAHEDAVAVVSPDGQRLERQIALSPFPEAEFHDAYGRPLRGLMPSGLALANARLYVAESGINAVGVIDVEQGKILGHIPVGWYPAAVAISPDQRNLYVANSKGKGSGPNAGNKTTSGTYEGGGTYVGNLELGSISVIPLDTKAELKKSTAMVLQNNEAAGQPSGPLPHIRHAFLIVRENRTFDEVFGDLPGVDGAPQLARYGVNGWAEENPSVRGVSVTPNAHALAARFATSDRFFADSDVSTDGHRWVVGMAPTPWLDIAWPATESNRRTENPLSSAPGRRAITGNTDGPMPEDEPEFGSLWEHVAGAGLPLFNYGEGLEVEGVDEREGTEPEGQRLYLNAPVPEPVFESTDRVYATFNTGIPDQDRAAEFSRDFLRKAAKNYAPALTVIRLPNDHTSDPRPGDGYPYRAS
jgi:YVTN family beta-propeller protein